VDYYNYNNVRIRVNNQDLLADTASFSVGTNVAKSDRIDQKGAFGYAPAGGIKTSVTLSFHVQAADPFWASTHNNDTTYSLDAAGLTLQTGYLTSYKFSASPHSLVKITVGLDFYEDFGGTFTPTILPDEKRNYLKYSNMTLTLQGINITSRVLSMDYDIGNRIDPVYKIGNVTPSEVRFGEKTTSLGLSTYNIFEALPYQGKEVQVNASLGDMTYRIKGILKAKSINFGVGSKLTSDLSIEQNSYGEEPTVTNSAPSAFNTATSTWLTITGTSLSNVTAVYFNKGIRSNEIKVTSDTEILVKVPKFATSGPYRVITPAGEASSTIIISNPIFKS
jgi:hypothetical protein